MEARCDTCRCYAGDDLVWLDELYSELTVALCIYVGNVEIERVEKNLVANTDLHVGTVPVVKVFFSRASRHCSRMAC